MGQIVGAALVSHHPGLFQTDEFRLTAGAGKDSDLIPGYDRVRAKIDAVKPDVLVILDTHWFTTGFHLVDGGAHYSGTYISDEMPWYLHDRKYNYEGAPDLAKLCAAVAHERNILAKNADEADLPRHYATINIVEKLCHGEKVMTVGSCQTAKTHHFLEMGAAVGEAIRRSPYRVVLLASGALSHKFNDLDWVQKSPRIFDAENVSDPKLAESDRKAIKLLEAGRHDAILDNFAEYRAIPWEALGAHYLQMIAALGGRECRSKGEVLSEYENARGTGNVHIWFPVDHT
jgi:aromatic ring-opening dioxygenase catalytic subunit (LigB family)